MDKQVLFGTVVLLALLFAVDAGSFMSSSTHIQRWENKGLNLCPTCVQFSEQAINTLLNIILNTGVVGGCTELCGLLANKTGSQPLGEVCTLLCDIVGVEAFAKLIEKADLDPIYFCELIDTCTVNDNGDAKISGLSVSPMKGPAGTEFSVNLQYHSNNGTGTGEIYVGVATVDGIPLASSFLVQAQPAGDYVSNITVSASPDPSCDPTQQPCENWLPGNYNVTVAVCNGECGSKHAHSQIYDEQTTSFQVTEN